LATRITSIWRFDTYTCPVVSADCHPDPRPIGNPSSLNSGPTRGVMALLIETPAPPGPLTIFPHSKSHTIGELPRVGSCRAARPDKNLRQVLKNMDSLGKKSTISPTWDHFVILLSLRTSPPIEYATRVDAGKQQPVSCLQSASLHTRLHDVVGKWQN